MGSQRRLNRANLGQTNLLRMQFQVELGKPFLQSRQTASSVGFFAESDHKVVGMTHDDDFALSLFPPGFDPQVQHVVQEDVRVEMPRGLVFPSPLGMWTRRSGLG